MNRPESEVQASPVSDLRHLGPDRTNPDRERWLDVAKGMAILLMVFGHIWGGLMASKVVDNTGFNTSLYTWIYTFHMPAFIFMAGLFLVRSVDRSLRAFMLNRLGSLWYPAVLWGLITFVATWNFRAYINSDPARRPLWNVFYHPASSYGFLLILLELSLLWAVARSLRLPVWVPPFLAAAVLAFGLLTDNGTAINFGGYGLWLSTAASLRNRVLALSNLPSSTLLAITAAGCAIVTAGTVFAPVDSTPGHMLCTPAGIAMLLAVAVLLERTPLAAPLAHCGSFSLEIYLMHSLIWVACRIVLLRFLHVTQPLILVPTLMLCGVLGSLAAARVARHLGLNWLFRLRFP